MNLPTFSSTDFPHQVIDRFWETIPPLWHGIRARITQEARESFNLTHEQFHILRRIRKGCATVSDLAEDRRISRPVVSRAVDVLAEKGLLTRTQDMRDRRHVRLALTAQGEAVLETIFARVTAWMHEKLVTINDADLEQIMRSMEMLHKAFQ